MDLRVPHISFLRCGGPSPGCPILNVFFAFRVGLFAHSHRPSPIAGSPHLVSEMREPFFICPSVPQSLSPSVPQSSLPCSLFPRSLLSSTPPLSLFLLTR